MTNTAISSTVPDQVHVSQEGSDQELSHPLLHAGIVKGTPLITAAAIATGCAYVGLNDPETKQMFPACGFYAITGLYCPGCGMTRSLNSFLHGDIIRAIKFNALLMFVIPFLMYLYVWWMTWAFTGRELPKLRISRRTTWLLIVLTVVFIVGRNFSGPTAEFFALGRV